MSLLLLLWLAARRPSQTVQLLFLGPHSYMVLQADAEESLNARMESLHGAITASMSDLRGQVLTANDQLSAGLQEQLQELNDKVEAVESATATAAAEAATAAAMIIAVDGTAQEAVARLSEADKRSDPWSDWDILVARVL